MTSDILAPWKTATDLLFTFNQTSELHAGTRGHLSVCETQSTKCLMTVCGVTWWFPITDGVRRNESKSNFRSFGSSVWSSVDEQSVMELICDCEAALRVNGAVECARRNAWTPSAGLKLSEGLLLMYEMFSCCRAPWLIKVCSSLFFMKLHVPLHECFSSNYFVLVNNWCRKTRKIRTFRIKAQILSIHSCSVGQMEK